METRFVAIYRWRIAPEKEQQFREAWHAMTEGIYVHRGSHGSRLHRDANGCYVAIALWPSREAWEAAAPNIPNADELRARMRESIVETFPTETLNVIDDLWHSDSIGSRRTS
jgi:heme-degrading monooxygenase HmoA